MGCLVVRVAVPLGVLVLVVVGIVGLRREGAVLTDARLILLLALIAHHFTRIVCVGRASRRRGGDGEGKAVASLPHRSPPPYL